MRSAVRICPAAPKTRCPTRESGFSICQKTNFESCPKITNKKNQLSQKAQQEISLLLGLILGISFVVLVLFFPLDGCSENISTCLTDVYYSGTQAQWEAIAVGYDNTPIASATIHYESFGMKGDINGDGVVTNTDLQDVYKYLCGTKILIDSYALSVTDVNGDNTVNILDYQALYEMVKS